MGDVEHLSAGQHFRRFDLVAAQLRQRLFHRILRFRILVFDDSHRNAIDDKHHVGAIALALTISIRPLPADMKHIGIGCIVEIHQANIAMAFFAFYILRFLTAQPLQQFAIALHRVGHAFHALDDGGHIFRLHHAGVQSQ